MVSEVTDEACVGATNAEIMSREKMDTTTNGGSTDGSILHVTPVKMVEKLI
jgi:hypothetical protein